MKNNIYKELVSSILPDWFPSERFELKEYEIVDSQDGNKEVYPNTVILHFEENHIPPPWYTFDDVKSKWFSQEISIFDMPLRDKFLQLKLKRKRRIIKATGEVIKADISVCEPWTKNTVSLWFFLKSEYWQILA